jgi:hypothetical protein
MAGNKGIGSVSSAELAVRIVQFNRAAQIDLKDEVAQFDVKISETKPGPEQAALIERRDKALVQIERLRALIKPTSRLSDAVLTVYQLEEKVKSRQLSPGDARLKKAIAAREKAQQAVFQLRSAALQGFKELK